MPIIKGTTNIGAIYKGTTPISAIYKGSTLVYSARKLPIEFQEVEYIESTGTQYIDTGILPTERENVPIVEESVILFNQIANQYQFFGWGVSNRSHWGVDTNGNYTLEGGIVSQINAVGVKRHTIATYLQKSMELNIDNQETIVRQQGGDTGTSVNYTLLGPTTGQTFCYAKLYSTKITIQGTIVRNFVPCYRKADNVAGLYDLVNGVFYTNAGTGSFIVGGNV